MAKHAWDSYARYAWGENALAPKSKTASKNGPFESASLGQTIVVSLDTLYIMGLDEEFERGKKWIKQNLDFSTWDKSFLVFEINIQFIGGLLACYSLTGDDMFLKKAEAIARGLLPAFETLTGIPRTLINIRKGTSKNKDSTKGSSILSEVGSLALEFNYLSKLTGDSVFKDIVEQNRRTLQEIPKPDGLYYDYVDVSARKFGRKHVSIGHSGDIFYEYLLKQWIQSNREKNEARQMFDSAIEAITSHLLQMSDSGFMYFGFMDPDLKEMMDTYSCNTGGFFALAAQTLPNNSSQFYMDIAREITRTCRVAYIRAKTRLGPEFFSFQNGSEAVAVPNRSHYGLRPDAVESYFYMWRLTKDKKYREWAWDVVEALERHCRTESGYAGLEDVNTISPPKLNDHQGANFIGETLKYLYLIFSDDSLLDLNRWVFNADGHPLPIQGTRHPTADTS